MTDREGLISKGSGCALSAGHFRLNPKERQGGQDIHGQQSAWTTRFEKPHAPLWQSSQSSIRAKLTAWSSKENSRCIRTAGGEMHDLTDAVTRIVSESGVRTGIVQIFNVGSTGAIVKSFCGGRVMMTAGVAALAAPVRNAVVEKIKAFDAFDDENDPWGEHDFVSVEHDGQTYFAKIDYYDRELQGHSEDPTDPKKPAAL